MVVGMPPVVCLGQVVSEYNGKWKGDALCPDVLLRRVSQLFSTTRESQYSIGILLVLDYLLPAIAYWCWVRILAPPLPIR